MRHVEKEANFVKGLGEAQIGARDLPTRRHQNILIFLLQFRPTIRRYGWNMKSLKIIHYPPKKNYEGPLMSSYRVSSKNCSTAAKLIRELTAWWMGWNGAPLKWSRFPFQMESLLIWGGGRHLLAVGSGSGTAGEVKLHLGRPLNSAYSAVLMLRTSVWNYFN